MYLLYLKKPSLIQNVVIDSQTPNCDFSYLHLICFLVYELYLQALTLIIMQSKRVSINPVK